MHGRASICFCCLYRDMRLCRFSICYSSAQLLICDSTLSIVPVIFFLPYNGPCKCLRSMNRLTRKVKAGAAERAHRASTTNSWDKLPCSRCPYEILFFWCSHCTSDLQNDNQYILLKIVNIKKSRGLLSNIISYLSPLTLIYVPLPPNNNNVHLHNTIFSFYYVNVCMLQQKK